MNVTNAWFDQIYSNATATQAPFGANWVQNTDGFDTMDAANIMYTNSIVQSTYFLRPQVYLTRSNPALSR